MEEWAPNEESHVASTLDSQSSLNTFTSNKSNPSTRYRGRFLSLPFVEIPKDLSKPPLQDERSIAPGEVQRKGGLVGMFRRASISIRSRQRRHSHAIEERPPTAWHKLKSAASFQRGSKYLLPQYDQAGPVDSHEELLSPIPGTGNAPPIIPRGSGGAARATAAAQNEYLGLRHRQVELLLAEEHVIAEDPLGDRESGIGIAAISSVEPASYLDENDDIPRVDFITCLPAELAIQILAHLDLYTILDGTLVSRTWTKMMSSSHIWREAFLREKTKTYAMSRPVPLGAGLGVPHFKPDTDWKDLYRIKHTLERNWSQGDAQPVYLNGHLDSIYCVQFDE